MGVGYKKWFLGDIGIPAVSLDVDEYAKSKFFDLEDEDDNDLAWEELIREVNAIGSISVNYEGHELSFELESESSDVYDLYLFPNEDLVFQISDSIYDSMPTDEDAEARWNMFTDKEWVTIGDLVNTEIVNSIPASLQEFLNPVWKEDIRKEASVKYLKPRNAQ